MCKDRGRNNFLFLHQTEHHLDAFGSIKKLGGQQVHLRFLMDPNVSS